MRTLRAVGIVGLAMLVAANSGSAYVLYDSNGFESPTFVPGSLDGQDGWVAGTGIQGGMMPTVVTAPDPVVGEQAVRLEVPDTLDSASTIMHGFPAFSVSQRVLTVRFDIYRQEESGAASAIWFLSEYFQPYFGMQADQDGAGNVTLPFGFGWRPEAGSAPTVMGRYANVTLVWDFGVMKAFSWYDGGLVDDGFPIRTNTNYQQAWYLDLYQDGPTGRGPEAVWIDNFSIELVPEPATLALMGLGGLILVSRRQDSRSVVIP